MAPSCTLENGIKLEHPNPPSALRWWFQQLIPALCHECRRVIRAEHFDDPAAPFLCNTCLENCHGSNLRVAALIAGWKSNRAAKHHAAMGFPALGIWTGSAVLLFTGGYSRTGFFPSSSEAGSLSHSCSDGFSPWA